MPRCHRQRRLAAFQRRDLPFQHPVGGVHDPGVDVPEFLQREQPRGMARIVEHIGRGLIDRRDPRLGDRIGGRAGMHGKRVDLLFAHCSLSSSRNSSMRSFVKRVLQVLSMKGSIDPPRNR